jgi:teichuronic acid biosynthesis glycosyltransferase TuaH
MKKKMLYIMHIDWNWIKQRPQFLAEGLSKYYDVTVAYQRSYRTHGFTKNEKSELNTFRFLAIPFKSRIKMLFMLNSYFVKLQIKLMLLLNKYELVWVTHPLLYSYLPKNNPSKIIYDCMDDALEFPKIKNNANMKKQFFNLENELCHASDIIFSSSHYLKNKLIDRYGILEEKVVVVNNGIHLKNLENAVLPQDIKKYFNPKFKNIVYIGTISEWFDFNLILKSLEEVQGINYLLFGPTEIKIPIHKNIIYCGSVNHGYVSSIMQCADLLIMPFKVNELIKSVNPVKAYEYIYSGKPALIVQYEETEKFKDFLYLYNDDNEYIGIVKNIIFNKMTKNISNEDRKILIKDSTWSSKVKEIINTIEAKNIND